MYTHTHMMDMYARVRTYTHTHTHTHNGRVFSSKKRTKFCRNVIPSEISQSQKDKCWMISPKYGA